ncbi:DUF7146 domain-containing protein [Sphingomonas hankookensis]|uniref:DUF7146 domain-containing protein n=1 Tax=Sphingomonas hankookensis TaxID=563996 RepID=UPI003B220979
MRETLEEARRFLSLPQVDAHLQNARSAKARPGTAEAARRLWAASKPIERTVVSKYLEGRVLTSSGHGQALRFHPSCYYRPSRQDSPDTPRAWPAMIAAVTDLHGAITGVHRTGSTPRHVARRRSLRHAAPWVVFWAMASVSGWPVPSWSQPKGSKPHCRSATSCRNCR